MSRGLNVAMFVLAFSLAFAVIGGLGFYDVAGVGGAPGGLQHEKVNDSVGGSQQTGEFGGSDTADISLTPVRVVGAFWTLIADTGTALQWLGAPAPVAEAIETFARIAFGLFILVLLRGVVFDA